MDLDALLTEADPARDAVLHEPDSAEGARLYRRITGQPRTRRASRLLGSHRVTVPAAGIAVAAGLAITLAVLPGSPMGPRPAVAAVLDQAAAAAAGQPAGPALRPGQYLYVESVETVGVPMLEESLVGGPVTTGGRAHICVMTREVWVALNGALRTVWTPTGRQAISAAQGCHAVTRTEPGSNAGERPNPYFPLDGASLPTDPAALERVVEQRYADGKPDFTTFVAVSKLLEASQSPSVRAALYGVIKRLPGIMNLGPMTDQLGRHGTAVGLMDAGTRYELIFDPATSAVLEATGVVVTSRRYCFPATTVHVPATTIHGPHGVTRLPAHVIHTPRSCIPPQPVGTAGYTAYVASGVVNSATATPAAADGMSTGSAVSG